MWPMSELTNRFSKILWYLPWSSAILLALVFLPYDTYWVVWLALGDLLVFLYLCSDWKQAALGGLGVGAIFYGSCFFWINHLDKWGGVWAYVGWIGLTLTLALLFAVWAVFTFWVYKRFGTWQKVFFPALAWVTIEWFRSSLGPFGLSLYSLGYSQVKVLPLLQLASFTQVFGLSFLIVWCNSTLAYYAGLFLNEEGDFRKILSAWQPAVLFILVLGAAYFSGVKQIARLKGESAGRPRIKVAVVQANIPQEIKLSANDDEEIFQKHLKQSELLLGKPADGKAKPNLVIWPETVSVRWWSEGPWLAALAKKTGTSFLVGAIHQVGGRYYNSIILVGPEGRIGGIYDKVLLVPFGEYVPFRSLIGWAFQGSEIMTGEYTPAKEQKTLDLKIEKAGSINPDQGENFKIGPLICFESTFPQAAGWLRKNGAQFLVVVSNDAWFGRDWIIEHHFANSVFRAVEAGRWLVQAANTGISGIVAPWGEVVARTSVNETVNLTGELVPAWRQP